MLRFKDCPRCNGDVLLDKDQYGWYEQCLQCGCLRDLGIMVEVEQRPTQGEKTKEMAWAA